MDKNKGEFVMGEGAHGEDGKLGDEIMCGDDDTIDYKQEVQMVEFANIINLNLMLDKPKSIFIYLYHDVK